MSQSLLKFMSIELMMWSNHLILCHPLLLLASIFLSIGDFSNESTLQIRWPKYWSFSFSSSPSNEYSELISFSIDWFDLLAVQVTLKSLLQHHNLFLLFFIVQVFIFTPIRPWIHREWALAVRVPFHWSSRSVLLWVEQAGTSTEPKSLSLWLLSFSDHFPSHVSGSYLSS